jgi:hypothetical protein
MISFDQFIGTSPYPFLSSNLVDFDIGDIEACQVITPKYLVGSNAQGEPYEDLADESFAESAAVVSFGITSNRVLGERHDEYE